MASYRDDLPINPGKIVDECNMQPQLFALWSERWAKAVEKRDEAKRVLDFVEADLSLKYRRGDLDTGGIKLTEDSIKKLVIVHDTYQVALKEYNLLCKKVTTLFNAKQAFDQRKKMLETIAYNIRMEYYSQPSSGLDEESAQNYIRDKETKERINQAKKRKKDKEKE